MQIPKTPHPNPNRGENPLRPLIASRSIRTLETQAKLHRKIEPKPKLKLYVQQSYTLKQRAEQAHRKPIITVKHFNPQ
jgi:hypothetical protein